MCLFSPQLWRESGNLLLNSDSATQMAVDGGTPLLLLFFNIFIYLFLAVLGLRCCAWAFSSCGEQGLLFSAVHGLLTAVASLAVEHRL